MNILQQKKIAFPNLTSFVLFRLALCLSLITPAQAQTSHRQHINLDKGWRFQLGHAANPEKDFYFGIANLFAKSGAAHQTAANPQFNDSLWRKVDLPHDWAVELPFVYSPNFDVMSHGYKPVGGQYPETSVGWYRKKFSVDPADTLMRFQLQFDGIFRDAEIWLNGFYIGRNASGYVGCAFDITDFMRYKGENVLVVRVDATQYEGWFYEGAGIYRHVWLNRYAPLHIAHDGIFAHSTISQNEAVIQVETEVNFEGNKPADYTVFAALTDRNGRVIAQSESGKNKIQPLENQISILQLKIKKPQLWSLDNPYLYQLKVELRANGRGIDHYAQRFGIRSIEIRPDGVRLNGQPIKLQGVNCHQDHAGVGAALPDYLQHYRISLLKNLGVNAYRTSHHAPTPELLDACDSLGMLVMDEQRLLNSAPEFMGQFERLIRRDRSRTSVFMWSIGNEEGWIHTTETGKRIASTYIERLRKLDPTRTCTYAADVPNVYQGINEVIPVRSFNYRHYAVADYHRDHPAQPIIGTEMGSTVTTRGIYEKDSIRAYVPDQDITFPWWASRAEDWWPLAAENDFWLGGFVWTGLDYRGEPTPFKYPNVNSHFGIMDMCGFPKNIYYYYQSWWTDKDVLHISPHWNWREKRGQPIEVWVNSNADSVELRLNGRSLGAKVMPRNRHLQWSVNYEPGRLEAVGYKQGRIFETAVETTGTPFEVVVTPYKTTVLADGTDAAIINISVIDDQGREVPDADNLITLSLKGDARLIGVGNGDPSSHEPDQCPAGAWQRRLFNGHCQAIVQAGTRPDMIHFEAKATGLWSGATDIVSISPVQTISSPDPAYVLKGEAALHRPVDQMIGADISFLPELEARGMKFSENGVEQDPILLLRKHGFNYVRLRVFVDPAGEKGYSPQKGFCDLGHTLDMAKRVKAAGMKLLLDFHYSDYWADPGKQYKPAAWEGKNFADLKKALYDHTRQVIQALADQGVTPDMVQIGNEINHGIVWPEGNVQHLDNLAQLIMAGTAAVKSVDPKVQMMLHVALGGQNHESVYFIDQMLARGVHFDVIGQSWYPKWHGSPDDLRDNLHDLARRYDRDVIVVEYSHQKTAVHQIAFNLPGGHGKGTCIWEPLNTWEAIFDREGKANQWLKLYDELAKKYIKTK